MVDRIMKLMNLPRAEQYQFSLLHLSVSLRMVHLQRSLPWDQVAPSTQQEEQAILRAISTIFRLSIATCPNGARLTSSSVLELKVLPLLRHGGFKVWFADDLANGSRRSSPF